MRQTQRVGRYTVALGLMAFGAALLADNLLGIHSYARLVIRLWPLLLVGIGVEYLIRSQLAQRHPEQKVQLRFDIGSALVMAVVVGMSAGWVTVGHWIDRTPGISLNLGPVASWTESRTVAAAGVTELQINVPVGSLRLEPGDRDEVRVEATFSASGIPLGEAGNPTDHDRLTITNGPVVTIATENPGTLNNYNVRLVVYAPEGLKVRAATQAGSIAVSDYQGGLELESKVGRVEVDDGSGSLRIDSGQGQVRIRDFEGPVTADTNVGSIELTDVAGAVQVSSGTGSIRINGFEGGKLAAETRTGSINATTDEQLQGDVSLKTQNGAVTLSVPEESSMQVTAEARTGSLTMPSFVSTTRSGAASSGQGSTGGGSYHVSLQTSTGSITFRVH